MSGESHTRDEVGSCTGSDSSSARIPIRIITHNIRYATEKPFKGEELWSIRRLHLCPQLIFNSQQLSTLIGLQEVLHSQLLDVLTMLNDSSPANSQWSYIGVGRDDGKEAGEYSPIFYRPSIWHLQGWKTLWLSETPAVPSKGWDAHSIRILTIGHFIHHKTGQAITMLNTHLDNAGKISRQESAKMILSQIKSLSETREDAAILLTGDFNSHPGDAAYRIMTDRDSSMEDVSPLVPDGSRYGNEFTYTSFGYVDNDPSRIDFIFSRKGDRVAYQTYAVLANNFDDGIYLSDHRACVTDLILLS